MHESGEGHGSALPAEPWDLGVPAPRVMSSVGVASIGHGEVKAYRCGVTPAGSKLTVAAENLGEHTPRIEVGYMINVDLLHAMAPELNHAIGRRSSGLAGSSRPILVPKE